MNKETTYPPSRVLLILVAIGALAAVITWDFAYAYLHSQDSTNRTSTISQVPTVTPTASPTPTADQSAITYLSPLLNLSFTSPQGWHITEKVEDKRVYLANIAGTYGLPDRPAGWEEVWLSSQADEVDASSEAHTVAGFPDCCSSSGNPALKVTAGTIHAGTTSIRTYEFQGIMQAFWAAPSGQRYSATVSSPTTNQPDEIAVLKTLLATVTFPK